jgi:hypothetical protein
VSATLYVMLNTGIRLGPVASWTQGVKHLMREAENDRPDCQICCSDAGKDGVPGFGAIVTRLYPWRGRFVLDGGEHVQVQTFRYMSWTGDMWLLMWCADCGLNYRAQNGHIQREGCRACPKCHAVMCNQDCPRWHNWGTCPECKPTPAEMSAAIREGDEKAIAAARRVADAEAARRPAGRPADTKAGALGELAGSA